MNKVLYPGKIGVTGRRYTILPPDIFFQVLAAPIAVIKVRVGEDKIRPQVLVQIITETIRMVRP